jgi:hypothetical protein
MFIHVVDILVQNVVSNPFASIHLEPSAYIPFCGLVDSNSLVRVSSKRTDIWMSLKEICILRCINRGIVPPAPFELSNGKFEVFTLS